jgi:dUTP pyrophosphatase
MDEPTVKFVASEGARAPEYKSEGAAGADLRAVLDEPYVLEPGSRFACPTGLRLEIPMGYEAQVRPRSGLALEKGVSCLNSPGTIDSDYRGELKVILVNLGGESVTISSGDRIAQLVIAPVCRAAFLRADALSDSSRGSGGFGSTGR